MSEQVDLTTIPVSPEGGEKGPDVKGPSPDEVVTVFHNKDNFNVLHPLQNKWTLWYTKPSTGKGDNWNELLKEVITFDTVEKFWGTISNITPVSELPLKSDYHLFKEGVRPEWEDPQNKHGGKWSYSFKDKRNIEINRLWERTMMLAVGEMLEESVDNDEVMGVVVNVRKAFFRIGVWTRTVGKPVAGRGDGNVAGGKGRSIEVGTKILTHIGEQFKNEALGLPKNEQVEFAGHTEAAHSGSTRARAKFVV